MAAKKKTVPQAPTKTPTLAKMLSSVPSIGTEERAAFTAQFTPAECIRLGAQTRSAAVRECAVTWAAGVLVAVTGPEKELVPYAPERLAFVLECIVELDAVRAQDAKKSAASTVLRSARDLARTRLSDVRRRLLPVLTRAAKGNAAASAEVAQLRDHGASDRESAEGMQSLVRVARKLLTGTSAQKLVANSMGLTAARVDAAEAAAQALLNARDDVSAGASGTPQKDSREVNLVEGRVLHEMRIMKASIADARKAGASVPLLVPTAGVAHVFNKKAKKTE